MKTNQIFFVAMLSASVMLTACQKSSGGDSSSSPDPSSQSVSTSLLQTPVVEESIPASPSQNLNPVISGTAAANSSVQLFSDSACATTALASGTVDESGHFNIAVTVPVNSTTTFYALSTSSDTRVSICSPTSITYVTENTAPLTPLFNDPISTSSLDFPIVDGHVAPNETVFIYTDASCTQTVGSTIAGNDGYFEFHAAVSSDSVTNFYAKAEDSVGNFSACSGGVQYSSVPPNTASGLNSGAQPSRPTLSMSTAVSGSVYASDNIPLISFAVATNSLDWDGSSSGSGGISSNSLHQKFQTPVASIVAVVSVYTSVDCSGTPAAETTSAYIDTPLIGSSASGSVSIVSPVGTTYFSANYYFVDTSNGRSSLVSSCSAPIANLNQGQPDDPVIISHSIVIQSVGQSSQGNSSGDSNGTYEFIGRTSPNATYAVYTEVSGVAKGKSGCTSSPIAIGIADQNGYFTVNKSVVDASVVGDVLEGAPLEIQTSSEAIDSTQVQFSNCVNLPSS